MNNILTEIQIIRACEKAGEAAQESVYDFYRRSHAHQKGHEDSSAANFEAQQAYDRAYEEKEGELRG